MATLTWKSSSTHSVMTRTAAIVAVNVIVAYLVEKILVRVMLAPHLAYDVVGVSPYR